MSDRPPLAPPVDWLARARGGDRAAWRTLYDQHLPLVHRLARRLGASEREIADVCQEVFLRVWRHLADFRGDAQFTSWLYRITLNEVSRIKREGALRRTLLSLVGREPEPPPPPTPERAAVGNQARAQLNEILSRMKPKKRDVFVLYELEELSVDEIAGILGVSFDTAKSRLRLAREEFERLLKQRVTIASQRGAR